MDHVLIIDDDPALGRVLTALLQQAGYATGWVRSGAEALSRLRTSACDVCLCDLRMPGMDGLSLLASIKHSWPQLPVVILTAYGTVPVAVRAMQAGASDFLMKPFEREQVVSTLARVLAQAQTGSDSPLVNHIRELERTVQGLLAEQADGSPAMPHDAPLSDAVRDTERVAIENALRRAGGNRSMAARLLGVSRRTLYNKLSEHGLGASDDQT